MSAMSHQFDLSPARGRGHVGQSDTPSVDEASLSAQWEAVHEAATAVGTLAQLGQEPMDEHIRDLPRRAVSLGGPNLAMVARGVDDLAAVLQPGLRALLDLTGKGHDTTCAALTLWREFHNARAAILTLAPAE